VVLQQRAQRQEGPRQRGEVRDARGEEFDVVADGPVRQREGREAMEELAQERGGLGADLIGVERCGGGGMCLCVCFGWW
jgi:hypothetical protein